jgi:hypothetical protein
MNVLKLSDIRMLAKRLGNGKRTVGVYILMPALNTESAATLITTCYLKKANRISFPFLHEELCGRRGEVHSPISRCLTPNSPSSLWFQDRQEVLLRL